ncbi:MAG: hypothetical protein HOP19_23895 [Acidobacteria bacterium]|nr:hypothetical protein [Acidobacteriota bacterium]
MSCLIAVDAGTTNTRVWLLEGNSIVAQAAAMVGVRDTARDGNNHKLVATLRELIESVCAQVPQLKTACIAAAGMITSPLGLREVPHVAAPADAELIATHAWQGVMPEVSNLPLILFPGVKSGDLLSDDWQFSDVMRGEETLCVGLSADSFAPPYTVLNLGSHWKAIEIDAQSRIARSRTSLSGEMILATQTTTILASALPEGKLELLDSEWFEQGIDAFEKSGLARALFCVRLLELQGRTSPAERMSFLIGVYVASDLAALIEAGYLSVERKVLLTGSGAVAAAWEAALAAKGIAREVITPEKIEAAYLQGIQQLLRLAENTKGK